MPAGLKKTVVASSALAATPAKEFPSPETECSMMAKPDADAEVAKAAVNRIVIKAELSFVRMILSL
jgi:hypothetical protein